MANFFTRLSFKIAATREEAEIFISIIEQAAELDNEEDIRLPPDLHAAFSRNSQSAEEHFKETMGGLNFGIDCIFNETGGNLTIYDSHGAPNLIALSQCLQKLYPQKLPIGFVYADTCDKARADGFGGGYYLVEGENITHKSLHQLLENELKQVGQENER